MNIKTNKNKNMKKNRYQILSPDGFTLERDVPHYKSRKNAMQALANWIDNYRTQGYYSSAKYGRILLVDIIDFCEFTIIN
jgi:hypothetical protein